MACPNVSAKEWKVYTAVFPGGTNTPEHTQKNGGGGARMDERNQAASKRAKVRTFTAASANLIKYIAIFVQLKILSKLDCPESIRYLYNPYEY